MTHAHAVRQLRVLARERGFGCTVGSDRLVQAGLDALLAGVESPSLPLLAGLGRKEESEARELFDTVLEELGLGFRAPADPAAARWALAYWLASRIADGSLDPLTGADRIRADAATELDHPEALEPIVRLARHAADWNENWDPPLAELSDGVLQAARELLGTRSSADLEL
ncbi:hypothetical protein SMD11_6850 [Streptomyces albireticuli]|uniref:Uncharacterized protein n=1 Tax=Streptomyces albireticuli TaxID=1940 RepID=A0A1Z2LDP2_9ACTN|nr:hypothetical protein [Streptomyces albireticuli]ARZ72426.1 hypothetical protein SMD11_6850 [Streptomyces albireticuli]